jgi:hypothetical protein
MGPLALKRALKHTSVGTATLTEQYLSVLLLGVLAAYHGELAQLDFTSRAFWAFFLAGAIGASFGKIFYYKGIDRVGASKATSVKNSSPILTRRDVWMDFGWGPVNCGRRCRSDSYRENLKRRRQSPGIFFVSASRGDLFRHQSNI